MDILSPDTLTLLRDKNLREAVDEILQRHSDSKTVTVSTPAKEPSGAGDARESTQVTVRRLSA